MLSIETITVPEYELVIKATEPSVSFQAFIAIHSTALGPSLGGLRIYHYLNEEDALSDVLKLSRGMTYKSALAGTGLGGGKAVLMAPSVYPWELKKKHLQLFAQVLDTLNGKYITAADVGTTLEDLHVIYETTPYVATRNTNTSSGDPSRYTAWGVFRGIQAVQNQLIGTSNLSGTKVFILGMGHVGTKLAHYLFWEGADLIIADIDSHKLELEAKQLGAKVVSIDNFAEVECDIFAPCAIGGVINPSTIDRFKCQAIAGAANNQLLTDPMGEALQKRGILYAPDFVINAGGIINAAAEFAPGGYNAVASRNQVSKIYDVLGEIFQRSEVENKPTNVVADQLAEEKIKNLIGKRNTPIEFPWGTEIGQ